MLVEKTHENLIKKESEQSILGSMLLDDNIAYLLEDLSGDDFYFEQHKIIFNSMLDLHKKKMALDLITLTDDLKEKGKLETSGGISYITSLSTIVPTTSNIEYYIKIVKEASEKRKVISKAYDLISNLEEGKDIDSALAIFENSTKSKVPLNEDETLKSIMRMMFDKLDKGEPVNKIKTEIPIIDKCTGGIGEAELVAIGGNSGLGKSAIALRIALNVFKQGKKVLIISREMTKEQIAERIILSQTGIEREKYESRKFNSDEWKKIINTMEFYSTENIVIDDTTKTVEGIKRKLRSFKPDMIIVDYVQLLSPRDSRISRERQVAEMSRELKNITTDFHIPVIQLTQLAEKGNGNPRPRGEGYTRESRAIYHDSNIVIYLHNPTEEKHIERAYKRTVFKERGKIEDMKKVLEYKQENEGTKFVEIIVDKNRSGRQGSNYYWFYGKELLYAPIQ